MLNLLGTIQKPVQRIRPISGFLKIPTETDEGAKIPLHSYLKQDI